MTVFIGDLNVIFKFSLKTNDLSFAAKKYALKFNLIETAMSFDI